MFLEYYGRIITIDLTTKSRKMRCKADFVLTRDDILNDRFYPIAQEIAAEFGGMN